MVKFYPCIEYADRCSIVFASATRCPSLVDIWYLAGTHTLTSLLRLVWYFILSIQSTTQSSSFGVIVAFFRQWHAKRKIKYIICIYKIVLIHSYTFLVRMHSAWHHVRDTVDTSRCNKVYILNIYGPSCNSDFRAPLFYFHQKWQYSQQNRRHSNVLPMVYDIIFQKSTCVMHADVLTQCCEYWTK